MGRDLIDRGIEILERQRPQESALRAEHHVKQLIGFDSIGRFAVEGEDAIQSGAGRGRRREARVIALRSSRGHDHVAAALDRIGEQQLQLAGLVPARGGTGQVVTLDPQPSRRQSERGSKPIGRLEGSRELDEPYRRSPSMGR